MFKRLFVTTLLAAAAFAVVLVANTIMVPRYRSPEQAAMATPEFDEATLARHLGEAIRFRTISWQDGATAAQLQSSREAFLAFHDWISTTYPGFSSAAERMVIGDQSLLFTWKGSDPSLKPVLLMAHLDVVPVAPGSEGSWKHGPFSGDIADGYVWGRGSLDLKVAVVTQLEAAEALVKSGFKPRRSVMFAFGHDEETGGENGNGRIAEYLASQNIEIEFVDDEGGAITHGILPGIERPVAHVGVAEKGYVTLKLTAHSRGGHSSLPQSLGETAIGKLAHALERIEDAPFESHVDGVSRRFLESLMPAMSFGPRLAIANLWILEPVVARLMSMSPTVGALIRTTGVPTMIRGGIKENVLPTEAQLTINFRIHERDTIAGVVAHIRKAIDDEDITITVMKGGLEPSAVTDINGPQFELIKSTLEKVVSDVIVAPNLISGGTDSRYYSDLTRNIFRHVPVEIRTEDLEAFHGTNERVRVSSVLQAANFYRELLLSTDKPMPAGRPHRLQ